MESQRSYHELLGSCLGKSFQELSSTESAINQPCHQCTQLAGCGRDAMQGPTESEAKLLGVSVESWHQKIGYQPKYPL